MELISREKVLGYLQSEIHFWKDEDERVCKVLEIAEVEIEELPIIESRPKGKWIDNTCSTCGYTSLLNPYALVEINGHMKEVLSQKFCPNCGADMRGEE